MTKAKSKPTSKTETPEMPLPEKQLCSEHGVGCIPEPGDWFLNELDPVYLMKEQEQWEKLQTELKEAKQNLDQEGYRLSHECIITAEKSKKNKLTLSPEFKNLIERYKDANKIYSELVTKKKNYRGIGNLLCVNLSSLGPLKLGVLRCVCPECNHSEGLSMIIDGRDIN